MTSDLPYPIFTKVSDYVWRRGGGLPWGWFRRCAEEQALHRCLAKTTGIQTVWDAPCGPGRLFRFWEKKGFRVRGFDLSEPMLKEAEQFLVQLGSGSSVEKANVFDLPSSSDEAPELIACIRFLYYFHRPVRIRLIRQLALRTRRFLLLQYMTSSTRHGYRSLLKSFEKDRYHRPKFYCTLGEITEELALSGVRCLFIAPPSWSSRRVFVLCERSDSR